MHDSNSAFLDPDAIWRKCEIAWSNHLQLSEYMVTRLGEAEGNNDRTKAPLVSIKGAYYRAPDFLASKAGVQEYWEVKYRSHPEINLQTGEFEYWISRDCFNDYVTIRQAGGVGIHVALFDATIGAAGGWLTAELGRIYGSGRSASRYADDGTLIDAWIWPRSEMNQIEGPSLNIESRDNPVFPEPGPRPPITFEELAQAEGELRGVTSGVSTVSPGSANLAINVLSNDFLSSLDVLSRKLQLERVPRYSVLLIGGSPEERTDALGLLEYGIRVFLITDSGLALSPREQAFEEVRLLEVSVLPSTIDRSVTVVDGLIVSSDSEYVHEMLNAADLVDGVNPKQYLVVHSSAEANVIVKAGAGTGKTETMAEHLVFLLSTSSETISVDSADSLRSLRLNEVGLVTFAREAAAEMRSRISRTLLSRLRLCGKCVLPILHWLMQLPSMQISTIHAFAKSVISSHGQAIGLGAGIEVTSGKHDFESACLDALSDHIRTHLDGDANQWVASTYLWVGFLRKLWDTLERNGVTLLDLPNTRSELPLLDWSCGEIVPDKKAIIDSIPMILEEVSTVLSKKTLEAQSVNSNQLVPLALSALKATHSQLPLRHLFVDEFQDTDFTQIDFLTTIVERSSCKLFVVGDVKQGIYRFRGAEGNAFGLLRQRVSEKGLTSFEEFNLGRNFRSDGILLRSINEVCQYMSSLGLLDYQHSLDELSSKVARESLGLPLQLAPVNRSKWEEAATEVVGYWAASHPSETIGILCRTNDQALKAYRSLRNASLNPELSTHGEFFVTPAVIEFRGFLAAILNWADPASLLQLAETRWWSALMNSIEPLFTARFGEDWGEPSSPILNWQQRVEPLVSGGRWVFDDLNPYMRRLRTLFVTQSQMATLEFLALAVAAFRPAAPVLSGDSFRLSDRLRYQHCLDHLLTLIDAKFVDRSVSLKQVHDWLTLQISANNTEDEPISESDTRSKVRVLTIHRSKGLEFDNVLLPVTWFDPRPWQKDKFSLRRRSDGIRMDWEWNFDRGAGEVTITNVRADLGNPFVGRGQEVIQSQKEDARLLYVAMTRARLRLTCLIPESMGTMQWCRYLHEGLGS